MKKYHIFNRLLVISLILTGMGCADLFKEKSISNATSDSYYSTEKGFEELVKSCYPLYRNITNKTLEIVVNGTDIFTGGGFRNPTGVGDPLNTYDNRLNSSMGGTLNDLWDWLYMEISRTNTVISRADNVTFANPDLKEVRVSEAKFLRALSYFFLVQKWGDIPLRTSETVTADKAVVREPQAAVYEQIIRDLTEAEARLPVTATDEGRITKGAAQFLLGKVYLTRGWNYNNALGGSNADFQTALSWLDRVIEAYPLADDYSSLFPRKTKNPLSQYSGSQNVKSPEVIFAVQYSNNVLTNVNDNVILDNASGAGEPGNWYHSRFQGNGDDLPGSPGRTSDYNRYQSVCDVAPSLFRLYDPELDKRYDANFLEVYYAIQDAPNTPYSLDDPSLTVSYSRGDTVLYFPPWNKPATQEQKGIDEGGPHKYTVINIDQFGGARTSRLNGKMMGIWKFWEPNIVYGDGHGTCDFALFRSAEAYLLAAEAIVKGATGGRLGGADVYYNKVLDRAVGAGVDPQCAKYPADIASMETVSYRATSANITIDMILDESARELMGEYNRWFDLKRTNKLIERTMVMNPWTKTINQIKEFHLVRPIPQHEIDRSSVPVKQNPGY